MTTLTSGERVQQRSSGTRGTVTHAYPGGAVYVLWDREADGRRPTVRPFQEPSELASLDYAAPSDEAAEMIRDTEGK